jgi:hypothetical protein
MPAGPLQPEQVNKYLYKLNHRAIQVFRVIRKRVSDAQIQLISGHESKKSLEVYQHISLETAEPAYQEAVKSLEI